MQNCFCFLKGLGKISQNTSFPWPIFSCMQRKSTFCPYMGKYESDKTHILSDIAQWPSWSLRSIRTHWKIRWNHNLVFFHFFIFLLKSWVRRFQAKMIIRMKKKKKKKNYQMYHSGNVQNGSRPWLRPSGCHGIKAKLNFM